MNPSSRSAIVTFTVVLVMAALAQAQTFITLYNFTGASGGAAPWAGVVQDPSGNLYGTAVAGGDLNCGLQSGCGVVYKLGATGNETVLHSFTGNPDGSTPYTPLVRDEAGNIYGTTLYGGSSDVGTVFKIDTAGKKTVLYSFTGGSDGCYPDQGLVMDNAENLYGTTEGGNCNVSYGTIFEVDSAGKFILLHTFTGGSDGGFPQLGHLARDKYGNLYGVANAGGTHLNGVLYELTKNRKFTVLHSFDQQSDACGPYGSVVRDNAGNLYGTASDSDCDSFENGIIWKASRTGKLTILHKFAGGTSDGCYPDTGVTRDAKGNLYGVTTGCGAYGLGVLYELSASGKLTLLHSFDKSDWGPIGEVLRTGRGTLFGTTAACCGAGNGTVWSYVP